MIELADNDLKKAIVNIFKDLKENTKIVKELEAI